MAMVATASDYAQALKEKNKDLFGVSEWEKYFLQPTQQYFETAVQTEQNKAAYDISGAYSAYKKQQMQLMQQDLLSEGFKKKQEEQLGASYKSSVNQIAQQMSNNISQINEAYQETLSAAEADLLESGEKYAAFNRALEEYAGLRGVSTHDWYTREVNENGAYDRLNARGTADISKLLYDLGTSDVDSFQDWLAETYTDTYDFFSQNLADINSLYGMSRSYRGVGQETYEKKAQVEQEIKTILDYVATGQVSDVDTTRPAGASNEEYLAYLKQQGAHLRPIKAHKKSTHIATSRI